MRLRACCRVVTRRAVPSCSRPRSFCPSARTRRYPSDLAGPPGPAPRPLRQPQNSQKLDESMRKFTATIRASGSTGIARAQRGERSRRRSSYLVAAANDPDMRIRIKAIDALGQLRAKEATPLLVQQLFMRDTDLATKRRILACLGKIGDERATGADPRLPVARRRSGRARQRDLRARRHRRPEAALAALGDDGRETDDEALRGLAQEAIRKIRQRPAPAVVPAGARHRAARPGQPPTVAAASAPRVRASRGARAAPR